MNTIQTFFQGFIIGAGMSIPGFSGGTLAILLGIYNKLIYSVDNLLSDMKGTILFLGTFGCGGLIGFFTAAKLVTALLSTSAAVPLRYAFLGAAAAAMVPVLREAKAFPIRLSKLLLIVLGIGGAALIAMIPPISLGETTANGILMQLIGGVILAVALVLPGISGSQMLVTLGIYDQVMQKISALDIIGLVPLAVGCLAGVILTAKLLSGLLKKTDSAYLVILGFMLFSVKELIPRSSTSSELVIGLICTVPGALITLLCLSKEIHKTESSIL